MAQIDKETAKARIEAARRAKSSFVSETKYYPISAFNALFKVKPRDERFDAACDKILGEHVSVIVYPKFNGRLIGYEIVVFREPK